MEILHKVNGPKGSFYIEKDGMQAAEMTYTMAGEGILIIDHTEVTDTLRGTGAGVKLVMAAVEHARINELKIIPLCPFAKSVFDKKEEIRDVLK